MRLFIHSQKPTLVVIYSYGKYCDCKNVLNCQAVNTAVSEYYKSIYSVVDKYAQKRPLIKFPVWFTKEIINSIKLKHKF